MSYRDIIYYHCTGIKSPTSAFLQAHSSLQENKGFFSCMFLPWNQKRTDQQSQIVHWRTFGPELHSSCPLNMLVPLLLITCNHNWKYNTIVLYHNACQHHWNVPGKMWSKSNSGKSPMCVFYFPLLDDYWSQQKYTLPVPDLLLLSDRQQDITPPTTSPTQQTGSCFYCVFLQSLRI